MDLYSVCSRLHLTHENIEPQTLGPYDEIRSKSNSLGPDRGGCGGCTFFCALENADDWWDRPSELSGCLVVFHNFTLAVYRPDGPPSGIYSFDLNFVIGTDDDTSDPNLDFAWKRHVAVPPDPLDDSCLNLIRLWKSGCSEHNVCPEITSEKLPKRVIEVPADPSKSPRPRITDGKWGNYVILSHCWGRKDFAKLNDSLITQYQQAIPPDAIPKSFKDAIEITRLLGFWYLWIDALCIIQDNTVDWTEETPKMASYYGQSTLMISATGAEDSSKGILTDRDVLLSPVLGKEKRHFCINRCFTGIWLSQLYSGHPWLGRARANALPSHYTLPSN